MQRTERILIKPGHPNFGACHRFCGQARRLGNCAVYMLRQRFFAKEPLLTRSELDKTIRSDNAEVYRSMPSAASAQRQTQIISEQMKSWLMASASYRKNPEKFKARPNLPGYKNGTVPLSSVATATRSRTIVSILQAVKSTAFSLSRSVAARHRRSTRRSTKPL